MLEYRKISIKGYGSLMLLDKFTQSRDDRERKGNGRVREKIKVKSPLLVGWESEANDILLLRDDKKLFVSVCVCDGDQTLGTILT